MPLERQRPPQVLLVEDDDIDAMAVERAFRRAELEVDLVRARSGEEALDVLRGEGPVRVAAPYVVLLDLNMPGIGGRGFLDAVRADERLSSSVVFVLTTSSAHTDIARAYERQVAGYFVKEVDSGSNRSVIEALRAYLAASWLPGDA